jgi:glycosyltransferase involved in cell wall biosynthesis
MPMPGSLRSLYLCYLSLDDPLVQTQVVAYLEGLAGRGHTIHLLTYESKMHAERADHLEDDLRRRGITWHSLRYHKRPSLPATVYDALAGALVAARLVRRHRLDAVHARSHVPAATGLVVRRLTGRRLIFDIRGLLGDEYVDAGRWRRGGLAHRITEWIQGAAIARADGIVVLTERVRDHLFGPTDRERATVIPCCADLARLGENPEAVERARARLGLSGRPIVVYVGKLTEPYMDREMVDFFSVARRSDPGLALLVLTQADPAGILSELARAGIPESDYRITRCEPAELGEYLGTADFAICFCRPTFARIASSPTKVGEYLGAGLPLASGPGIGDVDELLRENDVGVAVDAFDQPAYERCAKRIRELASDPSTRARCREVAREVFSLDDVGIPRYDALYRQLAQANGSDPQTTP